MGKICVGKICVGKMCVDKISVDKICVGKICVGKICVVKICTLVPHHVHTDLEEPNSLSQIIRIQKTYRSKIPIEMNTHENIEKITPRRHKLPPICFLLRLVCGFKSFRL